MNNKKLVLDSTFIGPPNIKCSLCRWPDYEGDWGGCRWIRGDQTFCPECGRRFSGKKGNPISIIPHPFLEYRIEKRNRSWWMKFKKILWNIIDILSYWGGY